MSRDFSYKIILHVKVRVSEICFIIYTLVDKMSTETHEIQSDHRTGSDVIGGFDRILLNFC